MNDKIKQQITTIAESGLTNMFDTIAVQRITNDRHFYELVIFIEEHKDEYSRFILRGEEWWIIKVYLLANEDGIKEGNYDWQGLVQLLRDNKNNPEAKFIADMMEE